MEELIQNALTIGLKADRIALIDSSIYFNSTDEFLNTFDSVVILKGDPFTKQDIKINSKKIKDTDINGTE